MADGSRARPTFRVCLVICWTLHRTGELVDLSPSSHAFLAERLRKRQAALALIEGKEFLLAGIPDKACEALRCSKALAPTSQVRALLVGLRIAPRSTVLAARVWPRRKPRQLSHSARTAVTLSTHRSTGENC